MVVSRRAVTIRAPQRRVWDIVVEPQMMVKLDRRRVSFESMDGLPGTAGSSYVLVLHSALQPIRIECVVLDGVAPSYVRFEARQGKRWLGEQEGRLSTLDDGSCLMQWAVRGPATLGLGWWVRRAVGRELDRWTTGVAKAAEGHQAHR